MRRRQQGVVHDAREPFAVVLSQLGNWRPATCTARPLTGLAGDCYAIRVVARVADDEDRDASGALGLSRRPPVVAAFFCYWRGGDDGVGDVLDVEGVCYCCCCEQ